MAEWCPVSSTTSAKGPRTYGAPSSVSRTSSTASRNSDRDQLSARGSPAGGYAMPIDFQSLILNSPPTPLSLSAVSSAMSDDYDDTDQTSVSGASAADDLDNVPSSTSDDCVICGERATGNHFGAMSCEACKSFFRRTIRKRHNYKCRMTHDCEINRETRNHCQYCRLQKCYRSGMKKALVQDERHSSSVKPMLPLVRKKLAPLLNVYSCPTEPAPMPAISTLQEVDFFGILPRTDASILMQHVIDAERKITERHTVPSYASPATSLEDVAQAVREQLLHVIDWAKLLQEFKDLGSEERQAKSLKVCWMEIIVFNLATQRQPSDDSVFIGAHHLLSRDDGFDEELQKLIGRLIDELILPFRAMNLTDKEKACIRGLLFFSPEKHSGDLEMSKKMNYYQEQLMVELEEHCTIDHRHSRNRYGKILLRMSALQAVSAELWRYLTLHHLFFRGNRVVVILCTMLNVPEEKIYELINFTGGRSLKN